LEIWKGDNDMNSAESKSAYEQYRDIQVAWASAEDLMIITAQELVRLKEETGMNLFWDKSEEEFMRDIIESAETIASN
jgi:hypothetical protein